ncbi:cupin domain-containing protein [Candidatus Contubernalis alkaliaceticus]|uniref:cupin domain-containing protein n=1 Tax=Candidatus Contubernalis alkaliaceticus TaxID=338645 RepID=UPI001F4BF813|nr:cupin domain-containing protein [Candidatus Contubernalis alkalaceticus]UNC92858.1 cupin domain-containing protein [Candidatus Contubernalis alkalaceticus]
MLEKRFTYTKVSEKKIEKIVDDNNVVINHMTLLKDAGLPVHLSNSNVYMIIINGKMSIALDDQDFHQYEEGDIINIPYNVKMDVRNFSEDILEFFVVKAPNPKDMKR